MKYLCVGLVAGPLLAMLALLAVANLRRGGGLRRLVDVLLAGAGCLALFAPWLIRTGAYTGNPVFPLASSLLGATAGQPSRRRCGNTAMPPRRPI